jgi:hypothetical protein
MKRFLFFMLFAAAACKPRTEAPPPQSASAPPTTATAGQNPAAATSTESAVAPEVSPAGDIPDTQAFVLFTSDPGGYQIEVPEGWARSGDGTNVSFVNKLDGVQVSVTPATAAPTAATARGGEAKQIEQSGRAVKVTSVDNITLPSGPAVRIKYSSNSEPNAVTSKQVRLENETYLFFKNGKVAAVTVWAPQGADNADQWARMTKSFRWKSR